MIINEFPRVDGDLERILWELKGLDLSTLKDWLLNIEDLLNKKADRTELGPIKDDINTINEILKKLQHELQSLKASHGSSGSNINGDVLVEITNRIEKIELKLDGLDKKIA